MLTAPIEDRRETRLWVLAALFLVAVDPLTTYVAVKTGLAVEANPLLAPIVGAGNWLALIAVKAVAVAVVFAVWRVAPRGRAHSWVPRYAAGVGALICVSNVLMVVGSALAGGSA